MSQIRAVQAPVIQREVPCASCGYCLRGIPYDALCPECGRPARASIGVVPARRRRRILLVRRFALAAIVAASLVSLGWLVSGTDGTRAVKPTTSVLPPPQCRIVRRTYEVGPLVLKITIQDLEVPDYEKTVIAELRKCWEDDPDTFQRLLLQRVKKGHFSAGDDKRFLDELRREALLKADH